MNDSGTIHHRHPLRGRTLTTPTKLAGYAALLAAVFAGGAVIGAAAGPFGDGAGDHATTQPMGDGATSPEAGVERLAGSSSDAAGYTFAPDATSFTPDVPAPFAFRIVGPDGSVVTDFDTRHERDLHLIVVSRDLTWYQHLHPVPSADGRWSVQLALPRAGSHRAYADFAAAGGEPQTLAVDLVAVGEAEPQRLPGPASSTRVDGYEVSRHGEVTTGGERVLRFSVARDGAEVSDLEPYLGAYGHLVAIRVSDQEYLHVHPTGDSSPREVAFALEVPSPGAYRLFLDFQHQGVVRSAAFTLDVAPDSAAGGDGRHEEDRHGGH